MEAPRSIKRVIKAQRVKMGAIYLDQAIPLQGIDQIDPIILIHHWSDRLPGGKLQREVGVGPHPHRGFAPVTFIFKGAVHHRDSTGKDNIVHAGGTQWMHSGRGIVHSERPDKKLAQDGGDFEIIQFWINVPGSRKMVEPYYHPLSAEDTPLITQDNGKVKIGVVTGELGGKKGVIKTESPLFLLRLEFDKEAKTEIPIPDNFNALVYVLNGKLKLNNTTSIETKDMAWLNNDGKGISVTASENTRAILLSGQPIGEPVATYGPFVMNTDQEIQQALADYQMGKMGVLRENFN